MVHGRALGFDRGLWFNVSFMLMWTSVAASGFGDRIIQLAAWSMLGINQAETNASSIQAGVSFFFFLPYVLLGPLAGWLADTWPRKWILLACDETRAAVLTVTLLLVPAGAAAVVIPAEQHWKVYAIITAVGVLAAVFSPAKAATIPQIVPVRDLQSANAIVLGIAVIASLIGFELGGRLIKDSLRNGLVVAVAAYSVSGLFFAFLRIRPHKRVGNDLARGSRSNVQRVSQWSRLYDAVRYIRGHRSIAQLVGLSVLFWASATVLLAAVAALCKTAYGVSNDEVIRHTSTMMALLGAGMLTSSLWVAWMNTRRESSWFVMASLFIAGLSMAAMAVNRSYTVGLVLSFTTGFFGNAAMICVATLTQSLSADHIRGRVFGVRDLFNTLSAVVVNLVIWRLPDADRYMVSVLGGVAVVLTFIAAIGLWRQLVSGPMVMGRQNLLWRLDRVFMLVWHRLRWVGRHHVPKAGRVILAANHTTGIDPMIIQAAVPRPVTWVMLRKFRFRFLEPFWKIISPIAIDHEDGTGVKELRTMLRALHDNTVLGIFPEGAAQRGDRVLKDFQPGIALLAKRSQAQIVPVWIEGTPQTKNMLWHFLRPSRSIVVFGQPYRPADNLSHEQIVRDLQERVVALSGQVAGYTHSV